MLPAFLRSALHLSPRSTYFRLLSVKLNAAPANLQLQSNSGTAMGLEDPLCSVRSERIDGVDLHLSCSSYACYPGCIGAPVASTASLSGSENRRQLTHHTDPRELSIRPYMVLFSARTDMLHSHLKEVSPSIWDLYNRSGFSAMVFRASLPISCARWPLYFHRKRLSTTAVPQPRYISLLNPTPRMTATGVTGNVCDWRLRQAGFTCSEAKRLSCGTTLPPSASIRTTSLCLIEAL